MLTQAGFGLLINNHEPAPIRIREIAVKNLNLLET